MDQQRLKYLLAQQLADKATVPEQQELSEMLKADADRELFQTVMAEMIEKEPAVFPVHREPWQKMVAEIISIDQSMTEPVAAARSGVFRLNRWAAAAAILLLTGIGVYFLMDHKQPSALVDPEKAAPVLAILPVDKTVLVLSNGSQIPLEEAKNGQIATEGNTTVTKQDQQISYTVTNSNAETHYNVLSTARGGLYEVVLPDGSRVWLNSASSIRFPASFTGHSRLVELSGEAWFDVQHAGKIPFLIRSGTITTTVMGTAFDIKAYPGQKTMIVSVQRGTVKVQAGDKVLATLEKGRQVRVAADTTWYEKAIDTSSIAAWKSGDLYYKDESLEDVVADLQRVFKEPIQIKQAGLQKVMVTVSFNKNIGMQQALDMICRIADGRLSKKNGIFIIE